VSTYRLTLEYDGTDFEGWQRQPEGHRTVQASLEVALARVTGEPVRVTGAGRTDAGVHALGQVASASLATRLDEEELARALNAVLDPDLSVVDLARAPQGFHARFDARSKLYRYDIWNAPSRSPVRERFVLGWRSSLDVDAMRRAARQLVGRHDFSSFQAAGSDVRTSVRELRRLDLRGQSGGLLRFELEAGGFLRHMARSLVGTLLEVGRGRRDPDSMSRVLAARARAAAGPTAPARGLTLVRVDYRFPRYPGDLEP
jgi:tRNA pseudouridine38-40 synthase